MHLLYTPLKDGYLLSVNDAHYVDGPPRMHIPTPFTRIPTPKIKRRQATFNHQYVGKIPTRDELVDLNSDWRRTLDVLLDPPRHGPTTAWPNMIDMKACAAQAKVDVKFVSTVRIWLAKQPD
jgi:hypothetical protein